MGHNTHSDLRGKIKKAYVKWIFNENCCIGEIDDREVLIANSNKYLEREVIVKVDEYQKRGQVLTTRFISSDLCQVASFGLEQGFYREEYVLYGTITNEMRQEKNEPITFVDFTRFFNPGFLHTFVVKGGGRKNNYGVTEKNYMRFGNKSLSYIVRKKLPDTGCRVIISENEKDMQFIESVIEENELKPIRMEPLDRI